MVLGPAPKYDSWITSRAMGTLPAGESLKSPSTTGMWKVPVTVPSRGPSTAIGSETRAAPSSCIVRARPRIRAARPWENWKASGCASLQVR